MMWPQCFSHGVAALTYSSLEKIDLSKFKQGAPKELWQELAPAQKASLSRVAYKMKVGDIIFVKEGKNIVGKGKVTGKYNYDTTNSIVDPNGYFWNHQVPVKWKTDFEPISILLGAEQYTVLPLNQTRVEKLAKAISEKEKEIQSFEVCEGEITIAEIMFRQRNRTIIAAKKALSNGACEICGFNFKMKYRLSEKDCLVAHHLNPIGFRRKATLTSMNDILLVCPNCHAVAHTHNPPISPVKLKKMIKPKKEEL